MNACADESSKTTNFTFELEGNFSFTPKRLIKKCLEYVFTVVYRVLIARGCEDTIFLHQVSGVRAEVMEARIHEIFENPDDSQWYFHTVDLWAAKG